MDVRIPTDGAFAVAAFDCLAKCTDERQSVNALATRIDRLIASVNRLPSSRNIAAYRERWTAGRARLAAMPFGN